MAKVNYEESASKILELVGGKDNVVYAAHCITRLRINVKDKGLIKADEIDKVNGVLGHQWNGEQIQVIIGQTVPDMYKAFCNVSGIDEVAQIDENLDGSKKKFSLKDILLGITDAVVSSIVPSLMILIVSGLLNAVILILTHAGLLAADSPTALVFSFVADAALYFLPVYIGGFCARKYGGNMALGMLVGAMLIHPNFISYVNEGVALNVFGIPVYATTYSSSVIPAVLSVWVMCQIEKFVAKRSPDTIRIIVEPLVTMLIMIPLTLCVLAPIATMLSGYVAAFFNWFESVFGFLASGVYTALLPFIIMTGMHFATFPTIFANAATLGYDPFFLIGMHIANIGMGGATLAVALKTKNTQRKGVAFSTAFTVLVGGICEPCEYGVLLRYMKAMVGSMIGNFVGGCLYEIFKLKCYVIGGGNIFTWTSYIHEGDNNLMFYLICVAVTFVISFVATYFLFNDKEADKIDGKEE